ncbi:hypothetical protein KAR91_07195 [Candidatus Pacearchaeota archaeon]|nr:hypothetical protein [Candidatus Pacearchaeota archaeon]
MKYILTHQISALKFYGAGTIIEAETLEKALAKAEALSSSYCLKLHVSSFLDDNYTAGDTISPFAMFESRFLVALKEGQFWKTINNSRLHSVSFA